MNRLGLVIADASVVVAALNPMDGTNAWAVRALRAPRLFAPRVLPFEVATALRRLERNKLVGRLEATAAHATSGSGRIVNLQDAPGSSGHPSPTRTRAMSPLPNCSTPSWSPSTTSSRARTARAARS